MNNSAGNILTFVSKHAYPILLILFVLWTCIGVFPLQCYEEDGLEISLGADIMYREGWNLPPVYSYEYRMQPMMTIVLVGLKHLVPRFSCEQMYAAVTAVSSLLFLLGCVTFARHVTKESKTKILLAAMLLPEMYAIAMYSNTAIPAAACLIWALVLITRKRYWQSAWMMCLAPLIRLDIVIVYPLLLPLFYYEGMSLKKSIVVSASYGVAVVVVCLSLFWLMNADALSTFTNYERWNDKINDMQRFLAIFGYYSLAYFLLLPVGLWFMGRKKLWKELFLVVFPIALSHYFYGQMGNASKHFLYNSPFVIIAGVRAFQWIESTVWKKPLLKWATIVAVVVFTTCSVRKQHTFAWLLNNPMNSAGIAVPIATVGVGDTNLELAIGAGSQVLTGDEFMLGSGHLFYSWYIHSIKKVKEDWRAQQKAFLDGLPTSNIVTYEWAASAPSSLEYMTEGYRFCRETDKTGKYAFTIYNPERKLRYYRVYWTVADHSNKRVIETIDSVAASFVEGEGYIISAPNHFGTTQYLDSIADMGRVEKKAGNLYKILKK